MNIHYVTYPTSKPWCSDFTAQNLAKHSKHTVIPTHPHNFTEIKNSIIHYHNVQILNRYLKPLRLISKLQQQGNQIIAGLRGEKGKQRYDHILKAVNGISVGIDPTLYTHASQLNQNVYKLPPGENPEHFKPTETPKQYTLCWAGRDHKHFKHSDLINKLGHTYRKATYNNYIPHDELPAFYNSTQILVGFSDYEGFWRPCIEAAMCGLPIISTKVGIVPEIINKKHIIPFPAENNLTQYRELIQNLLDNPQQAKKIGLENRQKALQYSWEKVTPLHEKAWEALF